MAGDPDRRSTPRRQISVRRRRTRLQVEVICAGSRRAATGLARWLEAAGPRRAAGAVTVALVSDARIRALNRRYRRADRVTDVLSFPAESPDPWPPAAGLRSSSSGQARRRLARAAGLRPLGDIVIATGRARTQARAAGHALATELRVLALHGLLHLAGYDHERDDGRMARVERAIRRKAGLREGVIERADAARRRPVRRAR